MANRVAIVTGGSSGLGKKIIEALCSSLAFTHVVDWSMETGVDVRESHSVARAASKALAQFEGRVDVLINCAGVNFIEFIPKVTGDDWDRVMDTNAKGIFLASQALLPGLSGGTILNIVSNASHIPMTNSIAYNASKGAAAIMTKQMSRELIKTHGITVFGISPNRLAGTGMSAYIDETVCALRGWTPEEARSYQLAALPAGEETDPEVLAEFISFLLSDKARHKYLAGCDLQYGL